MAQILVALALQQPVEAINSHSDQDGSNSGIGAPLVEDRELLYDMQDAVHRSNLGSESHAVFERELLRVTAVRADHTTTLTCLADTPTHSAPLRTNSFMLTSQANDQS